jgi:hypothetical protein
MDEALNLRNILRPLTTSRQTADDDLHAGVDNVTIILYKRDEPLNQ